MGDNQLVCDRCGKPAIDVFPSGYDGEGNPIDEEALCWHCLAEDDEDIDERNKAEDEVESDIEL